MKHKILLATDIKADISYLLKDLFGLLNTSHQKYVSAYSPLNAQDQKQAVNPYEHSEHQELGVELIRIEDQLRLEEKARAYNIELELISNLKNFAQLRRLSTICDLMVWDQSVFSGTDLDVLLQTLDVVECPVLFLPKNWTAQTLVLPFDNSMDTIRMLKSFLGLFNEGLRKLPLSVLATYPEDMGQIEGEKVFIDYLKLFFNDMGIRLMPDSIVSCMEYTPVWDCREPFLLVGKKEVGKNELMMSAKEGRPLFIFKA